MRGNFPMNNQMPRLGMNGHGQFGYRQQQFNQNKPGSKNFTNLSNKVSSSHKQQRSWRISTSP